MFCAFPESENTHHVFWVCAWIGSDPHFYVLKTVVPVKIRKMPIFYVINERVCRKITPHMKFTEREVSDDVYSLDMVAVSSDWTRIEDPETAEAEGPDWFTTDVIEYLP